MATSPVRIMGCQYTQAAATGAGHPEGLLGFGAVSTRHRIVALLSLTWVPLVLLTVAGRMAAGNGFGIPLLFDYAVHVRFLVTMPVLIVAEGLVWPKILDLLEYLVRSGVVAEADEPALRRHEQRFNAMRTSWLIPVVAAASVVFGVMFFRTELSGDVSAWQFVRGSSGQVRSAAGWWYLLISVPVFQFVILFWAWRYVLWCRFLFRLSRLDLVLIPSHPDGSAGLRPIGQVHQYWALVVFALSSLLSVHIGLELVEQGRSIFDYRLVLATFLGLSLFVLFAPFLVFSAKLLQARHRGLLDYGLLAAQYTRAFDEKWIHHRAGGSGEERLLGSADIQSLADLAGSYEIVHGLRFVPVEMLNVFIIVLAVAIPFFPLAFVVVSPMDVFKQVVQILL